MRQTVKRSHRIVHIQTETHRDEKGRCRFVMSWYDDEAKRHAQYFYTHLDAHIAAQQQHGCTVYVDGELQVAP